MAELGDDSSEECRRIQAGGQVLVSAQWWMAQSASQSQETTEQSAMQHGGLTGQLQWPKARGQPMAERDDAVTWFGVEDAEEFTFGNSPGEDEDASM